MFITDKRQPYCIILTISHFSYQDPTVIFP